MLRSAAMNSLIEREDVIVVASVASIYGLGNPEQYKEMIFSLRVDQDIDRRELLTFLVDRQYQRMILNKLKELLGFVVMLLKLFQDIVKVI